LFILGNTSRREVKNMGTPLGFLIRGIFLIMNTYNKYVNNHVHISDLIQTNF